MIAGGDQLGRLQAKAVAVTALRRLDVEEIRRTARDHGDKIAKRLALEQFESALDELLGLEPPPPRPG